MSNKKLHTLIVDCLSENISNVPANVKKTAALQLEKAIEKHINKKIKKSFKRYFDFMNLRITSNHRLSQEVYKLRNLKGKETMKVWGKAECAIAYVKGEFLTSEYDTLKEILGTKKLETEYDRYLK